MTKKWMALALSVVIVFTMIQVGAYAETTTFSDIPNDWSTAALQNAVDNGLLNGADGKIMPQNKLTRAQMATIINRAFGAESQASLAGFADVVQSDWFYTEMAKAVAMETFQGSGNRLNPNDSITREQAFAVIARALNLGQSTVAPAGFSDLSEVSTWATGEVYSLVNNGYIQGSNGKLNPQGYITRAEFAQVMDNIINEYVNEAGEYSLTVEGNLMINTPGVTLSSSTITGDLIIGDGVGDGEFVLDDVNVTGRLLVRGGGTESIIITGDSVIGSITIAKVDGIVRVFAEDGTEIGEVIVDGKDDIILEGAFSDITVFSDDITIWATDATIDSATVEGDDSRLVIGEGSTVEKIVLKGTGTRVEVSGTVAQIAVEESAEDTVITVDEDGEVEEIVANSPGTLIEGEGKVEEVQANANDVVVKTEGTKVSAAEGTEGVIAGDEEVEAGESLEVGKVTAVKVPSAGGGGGGSRDDDDEKETVVILVSAISVPGDATVVNGQTLQLGVTVTPDNATNKTVSWSVTNGTGSATIDVNGLLTATGVGTVTVKAMAQDESLVERIKEITIIASQADQEAADVVVALIATLPTEVALTDKADIEEARVAYDALTPAQQALVVNIEVLVTAEDELNVLLEAELEKAVADANIKLDKVAATLEAYILAGGKDTDTDYTDVTAAQIGVNNVLEASPQDLFMILYETARLTLQLDILAMATDIELIQNGTYEIPLANQTDQAVKTAWVQVAVNDLIANESIATVTWNVEESKYNVVLTLNEATGMANITVTEGVDLTNYNTAKQK